MITRTPLGCSLCRCVAFVAPDPRRCWLRFPRHTLHCVCSCAHTYTSHFHHHPQVIRIKERVEEKSGIPPDQQRLIFNGKQMCVAHRLVSYFSLRAIILFEGRGLSFVRFPCLSYVRMISAQSLIILFYCTHYWKERHGANHTIQGAGGCRAAPRAGTARRRRMVRTW